MPHNEDLASRVRVALKYVRHIEEKKMFGGVAFMLNGHMACGVNREDLVLRLGNDGVDAILDEKGVRPCDFTGRIIKSMAMIGPEATKTASQIKRWVKLAVDANKDLPPK